MGMVKHLILAVRGAGNGAARPRPGQLIVPRKEDSVRDYPSAGLTPSKLAAILREADDGSMSSAMQLFEEMEEKDPHLYSVANTRRLALTGLPWAIVSAADVRQGVERGAADEAAAYCRQVLAPMDSFDLALRHLALAVGRNVAVAELIWEVGGDGLRLERIEPVDFTRLVFDDLDRLHILTEDEPENGIAPPVGKFAVHVPHAVAGHPQRGGLLRVSALVYLAKNLALKDWMIFSEIFGMPVRVARYDSTATPEEKKELVRMLESLGSSAAGIFSRAVELQIIESGRGTAGPPYPALVNYLNREMSKAWLGQTLTTETTEAAGTLAASAVHERVRQDIRDDDLRAEAATVRRDILTPLVALRFGTEAPVPYFRRRTDRPRDLREFTDVLSAAVNRLGLKVGESWAREALGIPAPAEDESVLGGSPLRGDS